MNKNLNKNKRLVVISDFDDTLANDYVFDQKKNSHKPVFNKELSKLISEIRSRQIPFLIATSRGANDPNLDIISEISDFPIIIESGAAQYSKNEVTNLINSSELKNLDRIKNIINTNRTSLEEQIKNMGFILLIRLDRACSIEFRIQSKDGKGLNGERGSLYLLLEKEIKILLGKLTDRVSFKRGGSSLSIVPFGISKESALKKIFKDINIDPDKCFVVGIGDSEPDKEIFKLSDLSVCVGDTKVEGSTKHMPGGSKSVVKFLNNLVRRYEQNTL